MKPWKGHLVHAHYVHLHALLSASSTTLRNRAVHWHVSPVACKHIVKQQGCALGPCTPPALPQGTTGHFPVAYRPYDMDEKVDGREPVAAQPGKPPLPKAKSNRVEGQVRQGQRGKKQLIRGPGKARAKGQKVKESRASYIGKGQGRHGYRVKSNRGEGQRAHTYTHKHTNTRHAHNSCAHIRMCSHLRALTHPYTHTVLLQSLLFPGKLGPDLPEKPLTAPAAVGDNPAGDTSPSFGTPRPQSPPRDPTAAPPPGKEAAPGLQGAAESCAPVVYVHKKVLVLDPTPEQKDDQHYIILGGSVVLQAQPLTQEEMQAATSPPLQYHAAEQLAYRRRSAVRKQVQHHFHSTMQLSSWPTDGALKCASKHLHSTMQLSCWPTDNALQRARKVGKEGSCACLRRSALV
eukprot:1161512-Pelagomonas_calceolata.AAC.28